jgi:hypothetical protein
VGRRARPRLRHPRDGEDDLVLPGGGQDRQAASEPLTQNSQVGRLGGQRDVGELDLVGPGVGHRGPQDVQKRRVTRFATVKPPRRRTDGARRPSPAPRASLPTAGTTGPSGWSSTASSWSSTGARPSTCARPRREAERVAEFLRPAHRRAGVGRSGRGAAAARDRRRPVADHRVGGGGDGGDDLATARPHPPRGRHRLRSYIACAVGFSSGWPVAVGIPAFAHSGNPSSNRRAACPRAWNSRTAWSA